MAARGLNPVGGRLTEVISIPARPGPARLQALIIPGNPGAAGYYVPFMLSLREAFRGEIDLFAVSQLGHGCVPTSELFSLMDQITHKVEFLREHMLVKGKPPVVVMGHSIGAYMALKAVQKIEGSADEPRRIHNVVAICPTLAIPAAKDTWRQLGLRNLVRAPIIVGAICGALGLLPKNLQRAVVRLFGGKMDKHAMGTTMALFRLHTGRNIAFLARSEFAELANPADWKLLRSLGNRCVVFCAPKDQWFQTWKWEQMWLEIPEIQAHMEMDISHGFCVSTRQSRLLAEKVAAALQGGT